MQTDKIPYTLTNDNLTVIVDGRPHTVAPGHVQFDSLLSALLKQDWESVRKHLSPAGSLQQWLGEDSGFTVVGAEIRYNGERLPSNLERRVWEMANAGKSPMAFLNFHRRLQENPSWRSVQQLYQFLQHYNIPLEEDGTFLTYKSVRSDMKDVHSGVFDNSPGRTLKMPRNKISDDPNVACHVGFHVGALGYVQSFHEGGVIVICRIDPANVVCVPKDESWQKIRVCEYTVVGFYNGQPMPSTTVDASFTNEAREEVEAEGDDDDAVDGISTGDEDSYEIDGDDDDDADDNDGEHNPDDANDGEALEAAGGGYNPYKPYSAPTSTPKAKRSGVDVKLVSRMGRMQPIKLMEQSIDNLRAYAKKLQIVGASKLAGGKTSLVNAIVNTRGRAKRRRTKKAKK